MKPDDWRRRGHWFDHRGHAIFYIDEQRGPGPTLVLIHGFPTSSWDFADIWPLIAPRFGRIIAADMIGFGFSAKPPDYDYDLVDQAALHENLLVRLGVKEAHLLVHDYGVSVAQELLARHLERKEPRQLELRSVTFLNGGLFPETHRARLVQKLLLGRFGPLISKLNNEQRFNRSVAAVFGPDTQPSPEHARGFWRLAMQNNGHRIAHRLIRYILDRRRNRERWVNALQETPVPLRVINGPLDPVSGAHMVARYRELVPNPDTVSLPGIGHYPQVEAPAAVAQPFLAFVERVDARAK
ncbi:pimeloyl-ACP methyl ester carboxylesterase [Panacagrimonas perspica]|uniref:Pimeloyl-ACP methyl ester carboxylesterase n=1 Tax=Panacagrimonas perspica TaxID=381431 RepID=A0A4R7NZ97_9GAMM|nr:alpha/beta hydrolase [Panacagrimonas perspica]TDU26684.1 pimeloyl-ACP methyl ester carboxylesterase [Panacagrimonas perspica]THD04032.1 alpha/beta hydrolase [Panacagrimonas perspica]